MTEKERLENVARVQKEKEDIEPLKVAKHMRKVLRKQIRDGIADPIEVDKWIDKIN